MRHEPRGSCALTLQNGRVRQLPKLPFTIPPLRNMRKVRKTMCVGALQSCFYLSWALKYPVSRVLLRTYLKVAHNTE